MSDSNIILLNKPEACDPLQAILKEGAQKLLAQAIEAEISSFLESHNEQDGKAAIVRNGYLPERTIQMGLGDIEVKASKTRDRSQFTPFNDGSATNVEMTSGFFNDYVAFTGTDLFTNFRRGTRLSMNVHSESLSLIRLLIN